MARWMCTGIHRVFAASVVAEVVALHRLGTAYGSTRLGMLRGLAAASSSRSSRTESTLRRTEG